MVINVDSDNITLITIFTTEIFPVEILTKIRELSLHKREIVFVQQHVHWYQPYHLGLVAMKLLTEDNRSLLCGDKRCIKCLKKNLLIFCSTDTATWVFFF